MGFGSGIRRPTANDASREPHTANVARQLATRCPTAASACCHVSACHVPACHTPERCPAHLRRELRA